MFFIWHSTHTAIFSCCLYLYNIFVDYMNLFALNILFTQSYSQVNNSEKKNKIFPTVFFFYFIFELLFVYIGPILAYLAKEKYKYFEFDFAKCLTFYMYNVHIYK